MSTERPPRIPHWAGRRRAPEAGHSPVLSTRVRLARNIEGMPFLATATAEHLEGINNRIEALTRGKRALPWTFTRLRSLGPVQRDLLAEQGLIHAATSSESEWASLAEARDGALSVLVNEEDHLRIQIMTGGLDLAGALERARSLDRDVAARLPYAVHPRYGFLTACPTNVGTGLRASVMLHLPALALSQGIVKVLQAVLHMGLAVRGLHGEGTQLKTVFFQVSNQITLGRTEEEIIGQLTGVVRQLVEREEAARKKMLAEKRHILEDKVGRALGILRGCRQLELEEAMDLLSTVWLGVDTGLVKGLSRARLEQLLFQIQPAHVQAAKGKALDAEALARARAQVIARHLPPETGKKPIKT